jgi:hypothetical protein
MGLEKIDFIWYVKKISLLAIIGYTAGALTFVAQNYFVIMDHVNKTTQTQSQINDEEKTTTFFLTDDYQKEEQENTFFLPQDFML